MPEIQIAPNWVEAQWILYDIRFNGLKRLEAFRQMIRRCHLSRRQAAELILDFEREREC